MTASSNEQTTETFKPQPSSHHCFVCGLKNKASLKIRFEDNGVDTVRAVHTVCDDHQGFPGVTHGGIVATMLDEVGGRTGVIKDPNRFMMTARIEIDYRQPVPTNTEVILTGKIYNDKGYKAQVRSEIRLPDGSVAAEAEMVLVAAPEKYLTESNLNALGWGTND